MSTLVLNELRPTLGLRVGHFIFFTHKVTAVLEFRTIYHAWEAETCENWLGLVQVNSCIYYAHHTKGSRGLRGKGPWPLKIQWGPFNWRIGNVFQWRDPSNFASRGPWKFKWWGPLTLNKKCLPRALRPQNYTIKSEKFCFIFVEDIFKFHYIFTEKSQIN